MLKKCSLVVLALCMMSFFTVNMNQSADAASAQYYETNPVRIVIKKGINEYSSTSFTTANKKGKLAKNKIVKTVGIAYTKAGTPRLKTEKGTYITANKTYVLKVVDDIGKYITFVPDEIVVKKAVYKYSSTSFKTANRQGKLKSNTIVKIKDITYTSSGTPRLKTADGTYITASKEYVRVNY